MLTGIYFLLSAKPNFTEKLDFLPSDLKSRLVGILCIIFGFYFLWIAFPSYITWGIGLITVGFSLVLVARKSNYTKPDIWHIEFQRHLSSILTISIGIILLLKNMHIGKW
jgi:hypothetical protein